MVGSPDFGSNRMNFTLFNTLLTSINLMTHYAIGIVLDPLISFTSIEVYASGSISLPLLFDLCLCSILKPFDLDWVLFNFPFRYSSLSPYSRSQPWPLPVLLFSFDHLMDFTPSINLSCPL